jgi:hypothetical protein
MYRILRVTNHSSFPTLPQFQAIIDFQTQQDLDESFAFMRQTGKKEEAPHGKLMALVTDFKISFTTDA